MGQGWIKQKGKAKGLNKLLHWLVKPCRIWGVISKFDCGEVADRLNEFLLTVPDKLQRIAIRIAAKHSTTTGAAESVGNSRLI